MKVGHGVGAGVGLLVVGEEVTVLTVGDSVSGDIVGAKRALKFITQLLEDRKSDDVVTPDEVKGWFEKDLYARSYDVPGTRGGSDDAKKLIDQFIIVRDAAGERALQDNIDKYEGPTSS